MPSLEKIRPLKGGAILGNHRTSETTLLNALNHTSPPPLPPLWCEHDFTEERTKRLQDKHPNWKNSPENNSTLSDRHAAVYLIISRHRSFLQRTKRKDCSMEPHTMQCHMIRCNLQNFLYIKKVLLLVSDPSGFSSPQHPLLQVGNVNLNKEIKKLKDIAT